MYAGMGKESQAPPASFCTWLGVGRSGGCSPGIREGFTERHE